MSHTISQTAQFPTANRLLRCRKTSRYFNGNGWTNDASQAQTFPDEIEATRACVAHDLHEVELVLVTRISGTEIFKTSLR